MQSEEDQHALEYLREKTAPLWLLIILKLMFTR